MIRILFAAIFLCIASQAFAQDAIGFKHYSIEESKAEPDAPAQVSYVLRLKLFYTLASQQTAILKVTADPQVDQNFVTLSEIRVRKGKRTFLELDIPIPAWEKDRLNLYIFLQDKDAQPGDTPLANKNVFLERASIKAAK